MNFHPLWIFNFTAHNCNVLAYTQEFNKLIIIVVIAIMQDVISGLDVMVVFHFKYLLWWVTFYYRLYTFILTIQLQLNLSYDFSEPFHGIHCCRV